MTDDVIELRGLRAIGICGALPEEQVRPQPFEIDLEVRADLRTAGASDRLDDTIDYGSLGAMVAGIVTDERFTLLERMAQRIADAALADSRVRSVTVSVRKVRPPVPFDLDTSGVRITRARAAG
ncbi:MAG TPA: dihydroneopterin aldolase [Acidimicrobiales bacterium]|nr:dihydroneopterin aldolase [Acidimicrobiales bacterium]